MPGAAWKKVGRITKVISLSPSRSISRKRILSPARIYYGFWYSEDSRNVGERPRRLTWQISTTNRV